MQTTISIPSPLVSCSSFLFCGRANATSKQLNASNLKIKGKCRNFVLNVEPRKEWMVETFMLPLFLPLFAIYHQAKNGIRRKKLNILGYAKSIFCNHSCIIALFFQLTGLNFLLDRKSTRLNSSH